jgi:hypothetical protein
MLTNFRTTGECLVRRRGPDPNGPRLWVDADTSKGVHPLQIHKDLGPSNPEAHRGNELGGACIGNMHVINDREHVRQVFGPEEADFG